MSIPTAVFLDTSVLDGQSYNFSSTALATFVPACKNRNLKLLLPDPTEREIKRHMAELSEEAVGLVEKARRTAPFLAKWKGFPPRDSRKGEVAQVTAGEWSSFLNQFEVVRLRRSLQWRKCRRTTRTRPTTSPSTGTCITTMTTARTGNASGPNIASTGRGTSRAAKRASSLARQSGHGRSW